MVNLLCDHPSLEEFIWIKQDPHKIEHANLSVKCTNYFMAAATRGEKYTTKFKCDTGWEQEHIVDAPNLLGQMAQMAWDMSDPGILYWDTVTKRHLLSEDSNFELAGTNPCVVGATLLLTDKGYIPIQDLVGQEVTVWNGYEWSVVTPKVTGITQPVLTIIFSDGTKIKCTPNHKFVIKDKGKVEARNLTPGSKLEKWEYPIIKSQVNLCLKDMYAKGFFCGDGYVDTTRSRYMIALYSKKITDEIKQQFSIKHLWKCACGRELIELNGTYSKDFVPDVEGYTLEHRLQWLAGLIDSDGTKNSRDGAVAISSTNKNFLLATKLMLSTLGIYATVALSHYAKKKVLPNGKKEPKEYECKECYRLVISASGIEKLNALGLKTFRVDTKVTPNRNAKRFVTIVEIIDDGEIASKVYCATEPKNNTLVFNGIMTGNCGELPLPEYGACLLGSINLSEFVLDPFTKDARIDYEDLCKAIRIAVRALNVVLDEGIPRHPLAQQQQQAADWRPIGLGIMGYADMCLKLGEKYTNTELAQQLGSIFINEALQESAELASEVGPYPNYNSKAVLNSAFFQRVATREVYEKVKDFGLRNSALLAVAPTGSISTMLGVSGGIEPIFDVAYMRKTQSLHGEDTYYKVYTPIIEEVIKVYGSIPDFVQTAHTILPDQRIAVQAAWQTYVDNAISSTINLPKSATPSDIKSIFIEAWRAGCKGITIHRAGNRRGSILGAVKPLERGEILEAQDNYIGRKRKLVTGCGNLWCMAFFDPQNKEMREVFLSKGSTGGCNSFMVGLSRMASMAVRGGVPLEAVVEQLESSGTCPSYAAQRAKGINVSKGNCCPSAVGKALLEMQKELREMAAEIGEGVPCPECGSPVVNQEGCTTCKSCGWSRCS